MKKILTNNLGLKIGSVLLAFMCWFVVLNIEDPMKDKVITDVPITVVNGSYLESMGLSYQLKESTVRVTVRGNRSIVNSLTASDIVVVADMTQIVSMESDPVMVPLTASCPRYSSLQPEAFTVLPDCVELELETLVSESYVVTPSTGDSKPDKNYEVGTMEVVPEQISISGPESLISKIDKVMAVVQVTNRTTGGEFKGEIQVIDKNQEAFTAAQMSYLTLKGVDSDGMVRVNVELWELQTDVSIVVKPSGTPKEGYQVEKVTTTPERITVVGPDDALEALLAAGNYIEIPSSEVDISDQSSDVTTKVDISAYLPENIRLATDVSSVVIVTTTILPDGSKLYEVPVANIVQENLGTGLVAVFGTDRIQARIKGDEQVLKQLKAEDIKGTVNLQDMMEGTYSAEVQFSFPDGISLVSPVIVEVTVSRQETTAITDNNIEMQVFNAKNN